MRFNLLVVYLIILSFKNIVSISSNEYNMDIKAHVKTGVKSSLSINLFPSHVDLDFIDIDVDNLNSSEALIRQSEKIQIRNPGSINGILPPNTILEFKIRGDHKKRGYLMPEGQSYQGKDTSRIKNKLVAEIKNVKNYDTNKEGLEKLHYDNPNNEVSEKKKIKTIKNKLVEIILISHLDKEEIKREHQKGYESYTNVSQLEVRLIVN